MKNLKQIEIDQYTITSKILQISSKLDKAVNVLTGTTEKVRLVNIQEDRLPPNGLLEYVSYEQEFINSMLDKFQILTERLENYTKND